MRISKDPEVRKSELIEASEQLFRVNGYNQTSVSDIVKKVGVAQGTFYYYFASKDAVLDAVLDHYIELSRTLLERLLADKSIDACKKIEFVANATLGKYKQDFKLAEILHAEENLVTHQKYMLRSFEVVIPLITAIVEQGVEAGIFNVKYPRETVELLMYAFGFLEDSVALSPEDDHYFRRIGAAEDILVRVLGVEKGRLKLDPSSVPDLPSLLSARSAQGG